MRLTRKRMSPTLQDEISAADDRPALRPVDEKASYRDYPTSAFTSDAIPPAYPSSTASFATVSLHMTDRIRFLQFPDSDLPRLVDIISGAWSNGIQSTRQYAGSYEVKLKGNPWMENSSSAAPGDNHARRLIRLLLEGLYNMGWQFETAVRACKKSAEKGL